MENSNSVIAVQFDTDEIGTGIENIVAVMRELVSAVQEAGSAIESTVNTVNKEIAGVESISSDLLKYFNAFNDASSGLEVINNLFPKTTELVSGVYGVFKNMFDGISIGFSSMSIGWGAVIAAVAAIVVLVIQNWDTIKAAIGTAAEWFNTNVIQPVVGFFTELWASITGIVSGIWEGIVAVASGAAQWMQDNVIQPIMEFFAPMVDWFSQLFGSIRETVSDVFYNIGVIVRGCWEIIKAVWGIVSSWFNDNVIQPVVSFFSGLWSSITAFASDTWTTIKNTFQAVGAWFDQNVVQPVAGFFANMWAGVLQGASAVWAGIQTVFSTVAGFFGKIFSEAWAGVVKVFSAAGNIFVNIKDAIVSVFKSVVNGLITGINSIVAIPFNGINGALSMVKNIQIFGLQPFSGLKTISVPQIPYLAQGAVLPANKPFLAVVGDQKSGTNIEAPLSVIQEAVAAVMGEQVSAMMAGFEALLAENRQLRSVVESIELGDTVIGQAAARYDRRRALARGGVL